MSPPRPAADPSTLARGAPGSTVTGAEINRDLVQRFTQSETDPYEFVMSSDQVDRMGDVVNIAGIDLAAFMQTRSRSWNWRL